MAGVAAVSDTKIEWADAVWNPITGCSKISEGCQHCYAERMAQRLAGRAGYPRNEPFKVTVHGNKLYPPTQFKAGQRVFVNSMGDLFHEDVDPRDLLYVFKAMEAQPRVIFLVLTKRPREIQPFMRWRGPRQWWPSNVWLGVTAENQACADERVPLLLQVPAAVRFVSVEPMLGRIDVMKYLLYPWTSIRGDALDWVICGAETGPGKRPMDLDWARRLRDQCAAAGVPYFFKKDSQGQTTLDGREHREFPTADG